jgi:transcriptional regulator with XRE-family HTH domain
MELIRQAENENIKRTFRYRKPRIDWFASSTKALGEPMAFGKCLRRERERQDMTLTELARRVEVSIAYLSRIERERENPPPDHLVSALARALDLPADDLFAAARRLPPDLRARTEDVIAVYRQQAARRASR